MYYICVYHESCEIFFLDHARMQRQTNKTWKTFNPPPPSQTGDRHREWRDFVRPPLSWCRGLCGKEACLDHPSMKVKKLEYLWYGYKMNDYVSVLYMYNTRKVHLCVTVHVLLQYIGIYYTEWFTKHSYPFFLSTNSVNQNLIFNILKFI